MPADRDTHPSVMGPERFRRNPAYPFGEDGRLWTPCFPEVHLPTRSFVPESFRGGCSFGARSKRGSPARDRLMAERARLTAGRIVAVHHKGEGVGVNAGAAGRRSLTRSSSQWRTLSAFHLWGCAFLAAFADEDISRGIKTLET